MAAVLAAEGASAAAGTTQVSLEALVAVFTAMPRSCVEDVYQQCGSDGAKALDVLLSMGQECSPRSRHLTSCQVGVVKSGRPCLSLKVFGVRHPGNGPEPGSLAPSLEMPFPSPKIFLVGSQTRCDKLALNKDLSFHCAQRLTWVSQT